MLGTAAGGGLPQWNCRCRYCEATRRGLLAPRLQASLAFSPGGEDWYLVNATPDVTTQMLHAASLYPQEGIRHTPLQGVLLTDAELDHTLGLLHLREGARWSLHATRGMLDCMARGFDVVPSLRRYADIDVQEVPLDAPRTFREGDEAIRVRWLETDRDPPLYTGANDEVGGAGCALVLEDEGDGGKLVYAPGVAFVSDALRAACEDADAVLFDGTFWTGDEMQHVTGGTRDARAMGHLAIDGPDGSAAFLAELPAATKRYVHINNTNPVLDASSWQRARLRQQGLDVAEDGEELIL
ncbi:MAG: MBL fold metallo-hydrolase [Trueperaceae bacterium]|nr:MBL fold metallo-hydrolase [Trueperaceae bacterium]